MKAKDARVAAFVVTAFCAALHGRAAPVWQKDIPDAYQHQRWGAKPGPQPLPLVPIKGAKDDDGDGLTVVNLAGGRSALLSWELLGVFNPPFAAPNDNRATALGAFTGWCNIATDVNQFYHFKQKGFAVTTGNVASAGDLHNEVRALARDFLLYGTSANFTKDLNRVLIGRGIAPTKTKDGLTTQNYKQGANKVIFRSSVDGQAEKELPKTTLFEHLVTAFKFGDTASLRLSYAEDPGQNAPQRALWWRGPPADGNGNETGAFHSVAVAGYDTADNGTIWFADPDSNPTNNGATGNKNSDAGWDEIASGFVYSPASSDNWLAAAGAAVPVKQRRFGNADVVPKPAQAEPTQAEQDKLYFKGTLAQSKTELAIAGADYKRYDTVKLRFLETIEVVKGGKKPRGPGALADTLTFQISPGQPSTGPYAITGRINEGSVFSAHAAEQITAVTNVRVNDVAVPWTVVTNRDTVQPGVWNVYLFGQNSTDAWGNPVRWGGVSLRAGSGVAALAGLDQLEFDYATQGGEELSAWDFVYNDSADLTLSSLGVQVLGGGYDLPVLQGPGAPPFVIAAVPALGEWGTALLILLLALVGAWTLRRSRRPAGST